MGSACLKEIRFRKGLTQWQLERMSTVWQSRISLIEHGLPAKKRERLRLAQALGLKEQDITWPPGIVERLDDER
jgi:transcriptional regulator with XRE-family HTH domain